MYFFIISPANAAEENLVGKWVEGWVTKKAVIFFTKPCFEEILLDYDSAKFEFARIDYDTPGRPTSNVLEGRINSKNTYGAYTGWQPFRIVLIEGENVKIHYIHYDNRLSICHPLTKAAIMVNDFLRHLLENNNPNIPVTPPKK